MGGIAIAAGSQLAADAGARVVEEGGNAVDVAIAAILVLMVSEPGVCAPGAGGFIAIHRQGEQPITVDANVAMPGHDGDAAKIGVRTRSTTMEYGGGVTTTIGYESIAVPGGIAGLGAASLEWGAVPWAIVVAPAAELARAGMPMSSAAHMYLEYTHETIFGWHPVSHDAIHDDRGALLAEGALIQVQGLADSLDRLAEAGAGDLYRGELASVLIEDLAAGGSLVTASDLASYTPEPRPSIEAAVGPWTIFTNPPPSIGGVTLTAMLRLAMGSAEGPVPVDKIIAAQNVVLTHRRDHLDSADRLDQETQRLLDLVADGQGLRWQSSPSTVHASAVGQDGTACAITMSAGYGSGVVAGDTGFWMNNSLGEVELNARGFHGLSVGTRLPSNMAPTIATRANGAVLAIGSPGADRITTALQQVLLHIAAGASLEEAVDAPRLHVEVTKPGSPIAYEPGLTIPAGYSTREFDGPHMFFGGVAVAAFDPESGLSCGADARRTGGIALAGN